MRSELLFSEESYKDVFYQLLELSEVGMMLLDDKGNIHFSNAIASELLGYGKGKLNGRKVFELEEGLNYMNYQKRWTQAKENIEYWEVIWTTKSGNRKKLKIIGQPLKELSNNYALWKVMLPEEKEQLATLLEDLEIGAWQWNLVNGQFFYTPSFLNLLELNASDLPAPKRLNIVSVLKECMDIADFRILVSHVKQAQVNRVPFHQTFSLGNKVSVKKELSLEGRPVIESGIVSKVRGSLIRSFQSQKKEGLAQLSLDRADALICWIAPDCSLVYVNQAICNILGYKQEEMLHRMKITDIDAEHTEKQWEGIWERAHQDHSIYIESTFKNAKKRVFPVECFLNYLDEGGQKLISLSARDITKRRQKEAKQQMSVLEAKSLNQQLEAENIYLREEITADYQFEKIVTRSNRYKNVLKKIEQVAPTDATVLIMGETGTGKELLAHAIHNLSKRRDRNMVKVNCAVLSEELINSELFGHEKGAFTGAVSRKIGRFELAHKGTLLLDEIGEISLKTQTKLLRVLQEGEFERVGGVETIKTDVRIITATNRALKEMVDRKEFREDLYYRLQVFPIQNLPLRERSEDIPLLVHHFMNEFTKKHRKQLQGIKSSDMYLLQQYDFPGNIRELMNIIEQAVVISQGDHLDLSYWEPVIQKGLKNQEGEFFTLKEIQRRHILDALNKTKWKVTGKNSAAELLGLNGQTLFSKMRKLGIKREA